MAEFSKQYIEKQGGNMWDFDILEIASSLPNEHYTPQICEGYGFIAISKDEYDNLLLSSSLLINTTNCIMEIMLTKYFILSCYEIKCGVKSKITIALNSDEKKQFIHELKKLYQLKPNIS